MKAFIVIAALAAGTLSCNQLRAQSTKPLPVSAAEARQDDVENDPEQEAAERKREAVESTAIIKQTKAIHGWDSVAGEKFMSAVKYRRYRWADFDQVVFKSSIPATDDMISLMAGSPYAADIAYYLGKHPLEAAAIAQMPLAQSGPAIRAIEEKVKPNYVK